MWKSLSVHRTSQIGRGEHVFKYTKRRWDCRAIWTSTTCLFNVFERSEARLRACSSMECWIVVERRSRLWRAGRPWERSDSWLADVDSVSVTLSTSLPSVMTTTIRNDATKYRWKINRFIMIIDRRRWWLLSNSCLREREYTSIDITLNGYRF